MIELIIMLLIVGAVLYLISIAPFIDGFIKQVIYVLVFVVVLIYILRHLTVLGI